MSFEERVLAERERAMAKLAERAWSDFLESVEENDEKLADIEVSDLADWFTDAFQSEVLPYPDPTVEELRELMPELMRYVPRDSMAELASELPRELLADAFVRAVPKLSRDDLETLMRAADAPKKFWFTSEDDSGEHDRDIKAFAKAEAKRRLQKGSK